MLAKGGYTKNKMGEISKNDKHAVWTNYFLDHIDKKDKAKLIINKIPEGSRRHLYVIDMQNDFIDRPYGSEANGKFSVGDGKDIISPIKECIQKAISDPNYKTIVFSRDYHPKNHCSFFNGEGARGGNFPSHCLQETDGAHIIQEFLDTNFAKDYKVNDSNKIRVVFKGIFPNTDSFSAVEFKGARQKSSGAQCTCDGKGCSSVTGGFTLKDTNVNPFTYNGKVDETNATQFSGPTVDDGDVFEVCGLAGDYCVRDTALALKQKYPKCTVVVLNDLVRYPFLPLDIPVIQHRNREHGSVSVDNHLENLKRFLSIKQNKGLNYYLFNKDGLLTADEISKIDDDTFKIENKEYLQNYFHFISDPRALIEDYCDHSVKMLMTRSMKGGRHIKHTSRRGRNLHTSTRKRR